MNIKLGAMRFGLIWRLAAIFALTALVLADSRAPATAQAPGQKVCRAQGIDGRTLTWFCPVSQKCCFNANTVEGSCAPAGGSC